MKNTITLSSSEELKDKIAKLPDLSFIKANKASISTEAELSLLFEKYRQGKNLPSQKKLNEIRGIFKKHKILLVYIKVKESDKNIDRKYINSLNHFYTELLPAKLNIPVFVLNITNTKSKEIKRATKAIKTCQSGNRVAQVNIVVCRKNTKAKYEILVLYRNIKKGSFWQTITGGVHIGEDFYSAAAREIKEEIGLSPKIIKYTGYHFNFLAGGIHELNEYVFTTCLSLALSKKIKISDEHEEFKWLSIKEAVDLVKYDTNKKAISQAILNLKNN